MNGQLRNAMVAMVLLLTSLFFFSKINSSEVSAQGQGNCGCGAGYELVEKDEHSPFDFWQKNALVSKAVVKAGSQNQGTACFETTDNGNFANGCYKAEDMGKWWWTAKVKKIGGSSCKDISHVEFCKVVPTATPTRTPTPTSTPTPTPTPATYCSMKTDKLVVWPVSGNWNYTSEFWVKNNTDKALTFEWLLDKWWSHSDDQTGTTTLQPGEKISLGLGAICAKWQLDLRCPGDKKYDRGYIVEKHLSACITPTSTPSPTPTNTPTPTGTPVSTPTPTPVLTGEPTPTPAYCEQVSWSCQDCQSFGDDNRLCYKDKLSYCMDNYGCKWEKSGEDNGQWVCTDTCQAIPTPTEGPGKNVKFEVTAISCTNTNFDAKVMATENGQPLKGIKVQFEYKNEKIDRVTDDQGIAQAGYSFKGVDQVKARPDGFDEQSARIDDAANCPAPTPGTGGGDVLGATTQPQGQVLGVNTLAATGVMEDMLMKFAGMVGGVMTMVGSVLYGQKKRLARQK